MIDSIVMIINKLSKEYEPLLTAFMLYFFRLTDFFILNYEVNLFVAKTFILIFAYYYLPACNKMNIAPRKRAQIVTLRQGSPNFFEGGPDNNETISLRAGQII